MAWLLAVFEAASPGLGESGMTQRYRKVFGQTLLLVFASFLVIVPSGIGLAGVLDTLEDIGKTGFKAATAPYEALAKAGRVVIGQDSASSILDPYKQLVKSTATTGTTLVDLATTPQKTLYQAAHKLASKTGPLGEFVFDLTTFSQNFFNQLAPTGAAAVANVLRGSNPLQLTAAPLATAIRAARERHVANAKPLPDDVKKALAGVFSQATLSRAKFVVGRIEITLPNFIGKGPRFMGGGNAVVVDDIIVFPKPPKSFAKNSFWWTHEITHVEQYKRWGVESFAYRYARDVGASIEKEADDKGESVSGNSNFRGKSRVGSQLGRKVSLSVGPLGLSQETPVTDEFVAQCIFPGDLTPVNFMITRTGKIIAVDPVSGNYIQVGWASRVQAYGVAWVYRTPYLSYPVTPDGRIFYGNRQIGHVNLLQ